MNAFDEHVFAYLTTTGRVSGRPHTIEIWFAASNSTIYLLSGFGDRSDWVRNLMANGEATIAIGSDRLSGSGRVIADDAERAVARQLVFQKYQPRKDNDLTNWRDTALPLAIDLDLLSPPSGERKQDYLA